ncbi:MAG: NADPH-dependent FMN reductase [bacterium]|nr:NADPH-dependent FMN reductase [bacterium]
MYIPILLGTGRAGRQSEKVANFMLAQAQTFGFDAELYDVRDYGSAVTIPAWVKNSKAAQWKSMVTRADGLLIVTPEYNHGYPGELKIVLDSLYDEYSRLPVGLCSVSDGRFGGARVAEHILPVLHELGMFVVPKPLYFSNVKEVFDEAGKLTDSSYLDRVQKFLQGLQTYIALKKEWYEKQ